MASKASVEDLNIISSSVGNLENILNGYTDENNQSIPGLVEDFSKLNTKVANLEQLTAGFNTTYVTKSAFNTTVGDLNAIIEANSIGIEDLTTKVNTLSECLTWQNL